MTTPSATITIGGDDVSDEATFTEVVLRENAASNAQVILNNYKAKHYVNLINLYETVRIDLQNIGSAATEVFGGYLTHLRPNLTTEQGAVCIADCLGYDVALKRMRVRNEYGTQSSNPALDTALTIITNATDGIVPRFVNQVLDTATPSGYALQTANDGDVYIYNEPSSLRYLFFPYTPATDALQTVCDLVTADNYGNGSAPTAGVHWLVKPSSGIPYLCLDVVGGHHAPITNLWPTDSPLGTLVQGSHLKDYLFTKAEGEGNYVVYFGHFEKPTAERWTEGVNVHNNWGFSLGAGSSPAGVVGNQCVCCTGTGGSFYYPGTGTLGLDVTKFGTERDIPSLNFYAKRSAGVTGLLVELTMSAGNYYYHNIFGDLPNAGEWRHFSLPVGPYYNKADWARNFQWLTNDAVDWTNVNYVWFVFVGAAGSTVEVDNLKFNGVLTRGAKSNAKITAQKAKVKFLRDDIGKDDTLAAGTVGVTDLGEMAQLAKAELIRSMTTPIIGTVTIPLSETVLPGQVQLIQAEEKSDGTFTINTNFRITQVKHTFTKEPIGGITTLELTNDVLNGYPLSPMNSRNILLRAVTPDFQDRNAGSIKAHEVDLLQTILEENYT